MADFHLDTVHELRHNLEVWRTRLKDAEAELKYRTVKLAEARGIAEGAQQRVADYERLLAVAEGASDTDADPIDPFGTYADAQLRGEACSNCGREFDVDEPGEPTALGPRGQMFAHTNPEDCKGTDR